VTRPHRLAAMCLVLALAVARPAAAQQQDSPTDDSPTDDSAATANPLLGDDAQTLADELKGATDSQGVCYGWAVHMSGAGIASPLDDIGSGAGPGVQARSAPGCSQWVEFVADISYVSDSSESEDSAKARVESSSPAAPTVADIEKLGIPMSALTTDNDALTVFNATAVLPLLTAQVGMAQPVPLGESTEEPADQPGPAPGSDFLRTAGMALAIFGGMVLVGLLVLVTSLLLHGRRRNRRKPRGEMPGTGAQIPTAPGAPTGPFAVPSGPPPSDLPSPWSPEPPTGPPPHQGPVDLPPVPPDLPPPPMPNPPSA